MAVVVILGYILCSAPFNLAQVLAVFGLVPGNVPKYN